MKILIYKTDKIEDTNFLWSVRYFKEKLKPAADISVVIGSDEFEAKAGLMPLAYRPLLCPPGDSDLLIVVGQQFDLIDRFFELSKFSQQNVYFYSVSDDDEINKSKARAFGLGLKVELDNIRFNEQPVEAGMEKLLFTTVDEPAKVENVTGVLVYGEDVSGIFRSVDCFRMLLPDLRVGVLTNSQTFSQLENIQNRADVFRYSEIDVAYLVDRFQLLVDLHDEGGGTQRTALLRMFADQGSLVYSNRDGLPGWNNITHLSGQVADYIQSIVMQLSQTGRRFLPDASTSASDLNSRARLPDSIGNAAIDELLARDRRAQNGTIQGVLRDGVSRKSEPDGGIAYLAINGNGLGHAQRVANIAARVDPAIRQRVFCFNSCVPFLNERGFDVTPLVSRPVGKNDQNIELLNFGRLTEGTIGFDRFAFDGGYPYDSVVAFLQRFPGAKTWIRRGMWKAVQDNSEPKARAKFFDLIVRPGEYFEELNKNDEVFRNEVSVGPVVNLAYKAERDRAQPGRGRLDKFKILSMLGSGFIRDRSDILQAICQYCERRSDVEHVSVIWPQTRLAEDASAYKNTTFVSTNQGTRLLIDSDIVITAAGYNTFGDCMYYKKPAIFLPQQADWLDDQHQRADSARTRGLAELVEEGDVLGMLKAISSFCDNGIDEYKKAFDKIKLPQPANDRIAKIITG